MARTEEQKHKEGRNKVLQISLFGVLTTLLSSIVGQFELAGGVDIFLNFSKVGGS